MESFFFFYKMITIATKRNAADTHFQEPAPKRRHVPVDPHAAIVGGFLRGRVGKNSHCLLSGDDVAPVVRSARRARIVVRDTQDPHKRKAIVSFKRRITASKECVYDWVAATKRQYNVIYLHATNQNFEVGKPKNMLASISKCLTKKLLTPGGHLVITMRDKDVNRCNAFMVKHASHLSGRVLHADLGSTTFIYSKT